MKKSENIGKILEKIVNKSANAENENMILEVLFKERSHTILEEILRCDKQYQKMDEKLQKEIGKLEKDKLSCEQWQVIDEVLSFYNSKSWEYGCKAYMLGFRDALVLCKQLENNN